MSSGVGAPAHAASRIAPSTTTALIFAKTLEMSVLPRADFATTRRAAARAAARLPPPAREPMDTARISRTVESLWDDEIVGRLTEYIRIPNKSPLFDPQWAEHG